MNDIPSADRSDYQYRIDCNPDFSFLTLQLAANQTVKVEASAMASMSTHVVMKSKMKGGLSRMLTGENLFINEFTADGSPGELCIAPGPPGDLAHVYLDDQVLFLQNSAFVAAGLDVAVESKWQGLTRGFFSGESLFLVRCSGRGDLWFNTYGGMIVLDVADEYVVDTGHIVAFTSGLQYDIRKLGGYKSLFLSGEGLVCWFRGQGRIWIQTRQVPAFAAWTYPFRPVKKQG